MRYQSYDSDIFNEGSLHLMNMERDACGVGFVASISGKYDREVLDMGILGLCNLQHRGAVDADRVTGDGAGLLTQIPYGVLVPELAKMGQSLSSLRDLGVGVFFLPHNVFERVGIHKVVEGVMRRRNIHVLGWRDVPVNPSELGEKSLRTMPFIQHLLVKRPEGMSDLEFERVLFLARNEAVKRVRDQKLGNLYIASFSHNTIVYKALLLPSSLRNFYIDLGNSEYRTSFAVFHQRFSTNTFPTWALCHPFRMLAHNGEINTIRGNRSRMPSRLNDVDNKFWVGEEDFLRELFEGGVSDSASLDQAMELLVLSGRSMVHALAMLIPCANGLGLEGSKGLKQLRAFYEYHGCFSEPWDGPASLVMTDGVRIVAGLDRNGLRPSRWTLSKDGLFVLGSEAGIIQLDESTVISKGRLAPGEMLEVDTVRGQLRLNAEIKKELASAQPYVEWLKNRTNLDTGVSYSLDPSLDLCQLSRRQAAFGWTKEEIDLSFVPLLLKGEESVYSMGDDVSLSILSERPRLLSTYFKQCFAQVTNPPIDPIRERLVMSLDVTLGRQRNFLNESPEHCKVVHLSSPILGGDELEVLRGLSGFKSQTFDILWSIDGGEDGLKQSLDSLCCDVQAAVNNGVEILILSDRKIGYNQVPIPSLLATAAVHTYLHQKGLRMRASIVVDTGEARDTHQMATLFGFGASAVYPYLAYEAMQALVDADKASKKPIFEGIEYAELVVNYRKGINKGILKIMSKMGISVFSSYIGSQYFEALGISEGVIDLCFPQTASQIGGIGFMEIALEAIERHALGYSLSGLSSEGEPKAVDTTSGLIELGDPGYYRARKKGETHAITGPVIKNFHTFVKSGKAEDYEKYLNVQLENSPVGLKDLLEFVPSFTGPIPIDAVESVEDIRTRFTTAGMSLGAISPEAHETLAIAMNRIGGKSNSGEGGEDPIRFKPYANGDWANSKIKQVASGRFGVTAEYLNSAWELEIKMAQGAKPGEGGQLPALKANHLIARLRNTTPGVPLISPPPHHDIYSIEDLAQLIKDLKEVNPRARVCVKLVAEAGVGTIAAGAAKANADIILISGHDGGTGASSLSSIKHAGLPWELGLAEAQQVLMLNGLRDRVILRADGGLRNGRDIVVAAALGAEEFNFGTIALIALGCVYVRQCHLNNCPVGIATTDPKYRGKFKGNPDYVVNFFNGVAQQVREIMATLGVFKLEELIGRPSFLKQRHILGHKKANRVDLGRLLKDVSIEIGQDSPRISSAPQPDRLSFYSLDDQIIQSVQFAIRDKTKAPKLYYNINNTFRNIGTKLSGVVSFHHGNLGMPSGSIDITFEGSAGQSFGTFLCGGIKLTLIGEANDFIGKGMCGGDIIIFPCSKLPAEFKTWENTIMGNTVLYGATSGRLFAAGCAGERFAVRNSGAVTVVEGIGDHGCEYMTGGVVVVLGKFGKNFGAGMSGGIAYLFDEHGEFSTSHNPEMICGSFVVASRDAQELKLLINDHWSFTGSLRARDILDNWEVMLPKFVRVTSSIKPLDVLEEPIANGNMLNLN